MCVTPSALWKKAGMIETGTVDEIRAKIRRLMRLTIVLSVSCTKHGQSRST